MSLNNQVNYWLDYILGFQIQVKPIAEVDQVIAMYSNSKSNRYYRASNVETGVTYIAMLIVAALSCKKGDTLIVENPEIHLHPRAQSRLMEFAAFLCERGLQIIMETHSDHIYNGMRKCIKRNTLGRDKLEELIIGLERFDAALSWDSIVADRFFYYKRYQPSSEKYDVFAKGQFADKNIFKFRCGEHSQVRCFGYRKEEQFYVLRIERDHSISDHG